MNGRGGDGGLTLQKKEEEERHERFLGVWSCGL
jgi:hypothetical protein